MAEASPGWGAAAAGCGTVLLSVQPRDGVPAPLPPRALGAAYARNGLRLVEARAATPAEGRASGSTWAKRLRAGTEQPATLRAARTTGDGTSR